MVTPPRIAELVALHAAGAASPDERAELLAAATASSEVALALREEVRLHRLLAARLSAPPAAEMARRVEAILRGRRPSQRARVAAGVLRRLGGRRRSWLGVAAAALLALAIATGAVLLRPAGEAPDLPELAEAGAGVHVEPAEPGADRRLHVGDRVVASGGGEAVLVFRDRTRLVVAGDARVVDAQKTIALASGRLGAEVAKQPPGRRLTVRTPHAEALVVGTRFTLVVDAAQTRLAVDEGVVRLRDRSDGHAVEVAAGGSAQVRAADTGAPVATPPPKAPAGPLLGWAPSRFTDPVGLEPLAGESALRLTYVAGGRLGYGALRHDLAVGPRDQRLACRVRVESCGDGAILSVQAVLRDGGSWYLGYAELAKHRDGAWFRVAVPVRTATKKNSPSGAPPYRPDEVVGCTIGVSIASATIEVADLVLETDHDQEPVP